MLQNRIIIAAALLLLCSKVSVAQQRGPHDSITVTTLTFPGLTHVSPDELKRVIFTRASPCRLPFLIPVCKVTGSQLVVDRRRTTSAAMADDITKIRVYLWRRGFREARVDTVLTPASRGTAVAFAINEGPATVVSSLSLTQKTTVLTQKELDDIVELQVGAPFNLIALDSTLTHLRTAIWNRGFGDVVIDTSVPRPDASHKVPVRISIDPRWLTRVGHVDFEGNAYLSDETLRRGIMLQPGTLYTRDAILESQKRLFQSPAIARALVVTPPAGDSIKSITISVAEVPEHQVSLTLGFNTIEFGQAALEIKHNALGAGRWLSIRGAVGNLLAEQLNGSSIFQQALTNDAAGDPQGFLKPTYQASLTLQQPWIAGARTSAGVTAFAGRRSLPNVVIDEDIGATFGVVHELAPRAPVGLNYRIEHTRVQGNAVYYCAGFGICDPATRASLVIPNRLAPVGLSAWVDRADDLEVPTAGYTAVVDAEHASSATGSTFTHSRIAFDGSYYKSLDHPARGINGDEKPPKVLAVHVRGGFVKPDGVLHPRARFYAGGMQSVRGFAENELGPTVLQSRRSSLIAAGCTDATIANAQCDPSIVSSSDLFPRPIGGSTLLEGTLEARIPLFKALGAVAFLDGAYVGTSGITSIGHARGAVTPGAGFRYRSPLGVLRLDIGVRPLGARSLPVVVAQQDGSIITLAREKLYSPLEPSPGFLRSLGHHLVVHFAMGQAF